MLSYHNLYLTPLLYLRGGRKKRKESIRMIYDSSVLKKSPVMEKIDQALYSECKIQGEHAPASGAIMF